ncbi:PHP domain-containing protein [soil metagenome]
MTTAIAKVIDLHLHTHHSDGTWSPAELVEYAVKIGMKHIAISDHDTVSGIDEGLEAACGRLEIIPAIELNTIFQEENGARHDVHILGYYIDKDNQILASAIAKQKAARAAHVLDCIELVAAAGVSISLESVQECAGRGAIGKAHLSEAIVRAGGAPDLTSAYEKFMVRGSKFYADRKSISPYEAVAAIKAAGGIASIAHPGKEKHVIPLIEALHEAGLSGVEAYHRVHSEPLLRQYLRFAKDHKMLVTGGSDCHGPYEEFASMMGSIPLPPEVLENLRSAYLRD